MGLIINRLQYEEKQTLGIMLAFDGVDKIYENKVLELPWKDNNKEISCIPAGTYPCKKHNSPTFGYCFWVQNVPGRSEVLIHYGNYYFNTEGCILPGDSYADINEDGLLDVRNSKKTLDRLLALMPENFTLDIYGKY